MTEPNLAGIIEFMDDMIKWAEGKRNEASQEHVSQCRDRDQPLTVLTTAMHDKHFYRGVIQGFKLTKENLQEAIRRTIDIDAIFADKEAADEKD